MYGTSHWIYIYRKFNFSKNYGLTFHKIMNYAFDFEHHIFHFSSYFLTFVCIILLFILFRLSNNINMKCIMIVHIILLQRSIREMWEKKKEEINTAMDKIVGRRYVWKWRDKRKTFFIWEKCCWKDDHFLHYILKVTTQ